MRLGIVIFAIYVLVLGAGYSLNKGWVQLPVPAVQSVPAFDEPKFVAGVKEVGVVVFAGAMVPIEGKAVSDIRVRGTTYNPASHVLLVWLSATARGMGYVLTSECHHAEAGGWFCSRPADAGGYVRVN